MKMDMLIAATGNKNKVKEFRAILSPFGIRVLTRKEAGLPPLDIVEDGDSFAANSYKKARAIFDLSGRASLADDSGLCVDALSGRPGIYSVRFAGEGATDRANNDKLLALMQDIPEEKRGATFVCVITLLLPDGSFLQARGECRGQVIRVPRGEKGFGYDPLFLPDGQEKTFAELDAASKNAISHRALALKDLQKQLIDIYG